MIRALSRVLTAAENVLAVFSIVFLFSVVGLITFDVVGRRISGHSIPWIVEVAEYFLLFSTFMCSGWVLRENGHIAVDFIDSFLSEKGVRWLRLVAYCLTFVTVLYLLWFTGKVGIDYLQRGSLQGNFLLVPQWILYAPVPLGLGIFLLELMRQFGGFIRSDT